MAYNALDNLEIAKRFREQLVLEKHDLDASIEYEEATSKYDPDEADYKHQHRLQNLIVALSAYLGETRHDFCPSCFANSPVFVKQYSRWTDRNIAAATTFKLYQCSNCKKPWEAEV